MLHHVIAFRGSILTLLSLHMLFSLTTISLPSVKRKKKTKLTIAKSSSEVEYRVVDFTIAKFA